MVNCVKVVTDPWDRLDQNRVRRQFQTLWESRLGNPNMKLSSDCFHKQQDQRPAKRSCGKPDLWEAERGDPGVHLKTFSHRQNKVRTVASARSAGAELQIKKSGDLSPEKLEVHFCYLVMVFQGRRRSAS